MEQYNYKVYIKTFNGLVTQIEGGLYPPKDLTDWVLIDEGMQDPKYTHPQGNYLDKPLTNQNKTHNYIYENNVVRETTAEEKQAELASFPKSEPTESERISQLETLVLQLNGVI